MKKVLTAAIALLLVAAGCAPSQTETAGASEPRQASPAETRSEAPPTEVQKPEEVEKPERAERTPGNEAAAHTPASDTDCRKISADRIARSERGFIEHGTVGRYTFFGPRSDVLCPEPGVDEVGECELKPNALVKVEGPGKTYGLQAPSTGAVLRYGPDGVECRVKQDNP